jgi:hypothetical protein
MNVLGIFVKHPIPGLVKTRLAAKLGIDGAAKLYAAFINDLSNRFREIGDRRVLCYAPNDESAQEYFRNLAGEDFGLWPQPETSLGDRMARFFSVSFVANAQRVVVIGSDSPTLPADLVTQAFDRLKSHDCVLGPATDGGYYLIGQSRRTWPIFDGIDWSSRRVLQQTVARVAESGAGLALLTPWYDVDTADDLELLRGHLQAMHAADIPVVAPCTESCLENLGE